MKFRCWILILLIILMSSPVFAGWIFTENSEGEIQMTYIQGNKIKFVKPEQITIFNLNENKLIFINPKDRTYWSGKPEEFVEASQKSIAMLEKQMDEQLSNLPPDQRNSVQKALKNQKKPSSYVQLTVDIKHTDQTGTIIGYPVKKYEIWLNGKLRQEQWIASGIQINKDISPDLFRKFLYSLKTDTFQDDQPNMMLLPNVTDLLNIGWPLKRIDYDEDGYPETEETIKAEQVSIPGSAFEVPEHYQRISLMELYSK